MGKLRGPRDEFRYFDVCETCSDEECCADPYFTFCARNELDKIQAKVKEFADRYQDFLEIDTLEYEDEEYEWYGIKKIDGRCIFLQGKRMCMIHEVKPLHCRCYPLVWGYEPEGNKLLIYIDTNPDCALVPILAQNEQWIEDMKRRIETEVKAMSIVDRVAYNLLESDDTLKLIDIINFNVK